MIYYAHKSEDGTRKQTVLQHLKGVSARAETFSEKFHSGKFGAMAGMLHDIGKYSVEFQKRLLEGGPRVDHSTAGVQEIHTKSHMPLVEYCIAGHHGGLPDGGTNADTSEDATLSGRCKKQNLPSYDDYRKEVTVEACKAVPPFWQPLIIGNGGSTLSFFIRMLYSALVDADFLDTEHFMSEGTITRTFHTNFLDIYDHFHNYIKTFDTPSCRLNIERNHILQHCLKAGAADSGLYSLTVPTGGGKTLASLGFALEQVNTKKKDRIIYVIPYTSIIEQTASILRNVLGEETVLEHHMGVSYDNETDLAYRQKLATENWDAPIIVTTNVQFFESLYSNRPSSCRKLHNIVNSVIIFDEAQMLPLPYLKPCIQSIAELVTNYSCTAVLCSATQPALNHLFPSFIQIKEIIPNPAEIQPVFKRVCYQHLGEMTDSDLSELFQEKEQFLCVVNTRKHAQELYRLLPEDGRFHLSTLMRPIERQEVLKEIRHRLEHQQICRVISTSLIEAGVDVDFPAVFRAEAGLDSIIQAAGRCNREGKREVSNSIVSVFIPEEKYRKTQLKSVQQTIAVQRMICEKREDFTSPEAITEYFERLYDARGEVNLDVKQIVNSFEKGISNASFPFAQAAKEFHMIENATIAVLIPLEEEAKELVTQMENQYAPFPSIRKTIKYCVNIYDYQYKTLLECGLVSPILHSNMAVLLKTDRYDRREGLQLDEDRGNGIFF